MLQVALNYSLLGKSLLAVPLLAKSLLAVALLFLLWVVVPRVSILFNGSTRHKIQTILIFIVIVATHEVVPQCLLGV